MAGVALRSGRTPSSLEVAQEGPNVEVERSGASTGLTCPTPGRTRIWSRGSRHACSRLRPEGRGRPRCRRAGGRHVNVSQAVSQVGLREGARHRTEPDRMEQNDARGERFHDRPRHRRREHRTDHRDDEPIGQQIRPLQHLLQPASATPGGSEPPSLRRLPPGSVTTRSSGDTGRTRAPGHRKTVRPRVPCGIRARP